MRGLPTVRALKDRFAKIFKADLGHPAYLRDDHAMLLEEGANDIPTLYWDWCVKEARTGIAAGGCPNCGALSSDFIEYQFSQERGAHEHCRACGHIYMKGRR